MSERFCIHCKHYQPGDYTTSEKQAEFSRCAIFRSVEDEKMHRVDGRKIRNLYCESARNAKWLCGETAEKFEPRLEVVSQ